MAQTPPPSKDKKNKAATRRQYKSQKQQYYREQQRDQVVAMRKLIHDLQAERQRLSTRPKSKSLLAWKDVAVALKEYADESLIERHSLKATREKHIQLLLQLNKWIAQASMDHPQLSTSAYPSSAWSASHFSLARVSLVAHKASRKHGYDWFTQILYHNTDALMQTYQLPTVAAAVAPHRVADLFLDSSNLDCLNVIARYAMVFNGPFEHVVDLVKQREIQYKSYTGYSKQELHRKRMTVDYVDPEVQYVTICIVYEKKSDTYCIDLHEY
ncbi:hypothetical protein DYB36_010108 [Aphanomyces astaci]|uniref:Uncharacterized protein n=1 Tax=Aphanomyces astaci TaxID=112090 RepID=A0A397BJS9_APHAT|nr:hypothetical protein DYB36_010108 [Aphanomyces astaci]